VLVGWCWFLALVFPVLGFMQAGLQAHADRFVYLPHIGLTIAMTWTIVDLARSWPRRDLILSSAGAIIIAALTLTAFHQTTFWRDSVSIWTHTLAVTKNNQTAHTNIAIAFRDRGQNAEYSAHSLASNIVHWETILKDFPNDIDAHNELGAVLYPAGRARDAVVHWRASLALDPNDGNALNNLAWALATCPDASMRDGATAVALAQKVSRLPGGDVPIIFRTLAAAYAENGDFASAIDAAEHALGLTAQQKNEPLAQTLRYELSLYHERKPYREEPRRE
jgi:tetratricopeptide (TPR) repeat protein